MSILTVKNLSHSFGGRQILKDVNFRLLKGEHIGLVGPNGEGKSTFLNLVTGKLEAEEGSIEWAKRVRIGYLDQHSIIGADMTVRDVLKSAFSYLFEVESELNDIYMKMGELSGQELDNIMMDAAELQELLETNDFYMIDSKIDEIAHNMGIKDWLDRPAFDLSEHINWLRRYLQNYENAFILISHDISFLNSVINLIYHVENCVVNRYVGDYDEFLRLKELKQRQIEAAYKKQQQEIQELEDFVQRNKARVATRNMAMSRQKKLDKMEKIEPVREKPKPEFYFETAPSTSRLIFETEDLVIGYDKPISKPLNLRMERGDRIAIVGANGLGKTTLVNTILGNVKAISGSVSFGQNLAIGYFKQEEHYDNNNTPIDEMWEKFPSWEQFKIRAALAKCSLTNVHIESQMKVLSGGEQAKVRLCKILNEKTNILMLDEPTNHLDPESKEELKRALKEYKGGIFLISHEKDFYTDIATEIWNMEDFSLL